ncbi:hypothetical protein ANCCAN_10704 [Ancylostoma caninum]|uniref:Uncharacterized protein n=1 Tax=Ancylostoma caninum TaxID=29170 RepID=A0A368GJS9_ANCCA|nr:hypothetical protein ANCCAN_10704 [Ancylostoma caninum]
MRLSQWRHESASERSKSSEWNESPRKPRHLRYGNSESTADSTSTSIEELVYLMKKYTMYQEHLL